MKTSAYLALISFLLVAMLACRDQESRAVRAQGEQARTAGAQPPRSPSLDETTNASSPLAVRELDIGIAGDDESSERVTLNLLPENALQISLYRSRARQQQQTLVNSLFVDIGRDDYLVQKVDMLKNGRDEIVVIGTPRSGEGLAAYVIALSATNGLLRLLFNVSTPAGGSVNVDWDKQGFYLLTHQIDAAGEEVVYSYRWVSVQQRFVSLRIQNLQTNSIGDERMRRIYNREKDFMLSSLNGLWRWTKSGDQEQALLNFSPETKSMDVYLSSADGASLLPQERALERFRMEGQAFFYQGRISLDLTNSYLGGMRRWLSITYLNYDLIVIASSVEEPWLGTYQRVEQKQEFSHPVALSKYATPEALDGYFTGDGLRFDFNEGQLVLTKENNSYQGFYLFFLWQGIHILQYRAVNKEKQQEVTGLYRVEIAATQPTSKGKQQLALIPLNRAAADASPVLRLSQQPRPGEAAAQSQ